MSGLDRVLEALLAAERVVALAGRAVEAERHPRDSRVAEVADALGRERPRPARRDRHPEAQVVAVRDQLGEVVAGERVAPGEDDQLPVAERGGVLQQSLPLRGRQLVGVSLRPRVGPAVPAREPAGLRDLPDEHQRPPVRVEVVEHRSPHATIPIRLGSFPNVFPRGSSGR